MAQTSTLNETEQATNDHSLLMKPINIGGTGIQHTVQSLQNGTAEVRNLLLNECNVIYECKVCRSLHRSLANFIAHKRVYCMKHCCETMQLFEQPDIEKETVIIQPESPDSGTIHEDDYACELTQSSSVGMESGNVQMEVGVTSAKILQPIMTEVNLTVSANESGPKDSPPSDTREKESFYGNCVKHLENRAINQSKLILRVKTIDSNHNAVFQVVQQSMAEDEALVIDETKEKDTVDAVEDLVEPKPVLHSLSREARLKKKKPSDEGCCCTCFKCGAKFTSVKTMTIHLRSIHAKKRVYFPCPYCTALFSQSWGVVRHLLTIHKKTKEQVNRLRNKIRQKAWLRATADKDSEDEAEPPPATSDDKESARLPTDTIKSLQTGLPTVHVKKAVDMHTCSKCDTIFTQNDVLVKHMEICGSKDLASEQPADVQTTIEPRASRPKRVVKKKVVKDFVNSSHLTIRSNSVSKGENIKRAPPTIEKKILSIINMKKLECIQCKRVFTTLSNLRRHAATHVGWNRYKCKYCDYQSYSRSECRNHVKRVHITKRQLQNQADKFIVDLPTDEELETPSFEMPKLRLPKLVEDENSVMVMMPVVKPVGKRPGPVLSSENKSVANKKLAIVATPALKMPSPKKPAVVSQTEIKHVSKRKLATVDETNPTLVLCKKLAAAPPSEAKSVLNKKLPVVGLPAESKPASYKKPVVTVIVHSKSLSSNNKPDSRPDSKPVEVNVKIPPKKGSPQSSPQTESGKMSNGACKQPPILARKSPSNTPPACNFNISTRLSPRTFDTSPYRPAPQVATLVTRSGTYVKSEPVPNGKRLEENAADVPPKSLRKRSPRHLEQANCSPVSVYVDSLSSSRHGDHNYSAELTQIKQEPVSDESS